MFLSVLYFPWISRYRWYRDLSTVNLWDVQLNPVYPRWTMASFAMHQHYIIEHMRANLISPNDLHTVLCSFQPEFARLSSLILSRWSVKCNEILVACVTRFPSKFSLFLNLVCLLDRGLKRARNHRRSLEKIAISRKRWTHIITKTFLLVYLTILRFLVPNFRLLSTSSRERSISISVAIDNDLRTFCPIHTFNVCMISN